MSHCKTFCEFDRGHGCDTEDETLPPFLPTPLANAARTCESLGICQHPERECVGACEQKPRVPSWQPTDPTQPAQGFTVETFGRDNFVTCLLVAALSGATLGILYGAGRWLWQTWPVLS
jgi:hypothetical protein